MLDTNSLNLHSACTLLRLPKDIPITPLMMGKGLTATFYPPHESRPALVEFAKLLEESLLKSGAAIIPFEEALDEATNRIKPGIIVIEQGEGTDDNLGMYRLTSLHKNPLVSIYDRPCPVDTNADAQKQLDQVVEVLTWNLTHIPIFIDKNKNTWTFCTMNGAVVPCGDIDKMDEPVQQSLVPKLAAQIKPPSEAGIIHRQGSFDPMAEGLENYLADFMDAAAEWESNGLMLAHTTLASLKYRDKKARRFAEMYLDNRTGMSYGFMAYQLPVQVKPAQLWTGNPHHPNTDGNNQIVCMRVGNKVYSISIPPVNVLTTRSGCKKTQIHPEQDIVRMSWCLGDIYFDVPVRADRTACRPSYDTIAIISHAVANYCVASVLMAEGLPSFSDALSHQGVSISHWHAYPRNESSLQGYVEHGIHNPPVSCSTPQSAIFAMLGKLDALNDATKPFYKGDIHIEAHHGTVVTGVMSLREAAGWAGEVSKRVTVNAD